MSASIAAVLSAAPTMGVRAAPSRPAASLPTQFGRPELALAASSSLKLPAARSSSLSIKAIAAPERTNGVTDAARDGLGVQAGQLVFGFPKGSLQNSTTDLFSRAGFEVKVKERNYFPTVDDEELKLILFRSQEISRYCEDGILDAGICGKDWIEENGSDIVEVAELKYSKATSNPARWVLAVPEDSPVQTPSDLAGTIVASELVKATRKYFEEHGVDVRKVEYSWGATEVKAALPGVGAIVDITETGSSLRANKLRIVDTILESTTRLIANKESWEDPVKRRKIEDLALLLQGAIDGRRKLGLKMNLEASKLEMLTNMLPSEQSPTVAPLLDAKYVAVEVVVEEAVARQLVADCKRLGATGIVTYQLGVSI